MTAVPTMIVGKLATLIRLLSSDRDGEVIATVRALVRTLNSAGSDIHALAEHIEKANGGLTDADKKKIRTEIENARALGYVEGVKAAEAKQHGTGAFRNTDGQIEWTEVALFVQREKHRLPAKHRLIRRRHGRAHRVRARANPRPTQILTQPLLQTRREDHMSPQPQTNTPPSELEAALDYAHRGTPVFPTNPLDKKPLTANGFKDATADETQIRAWWQQWPNAMVAAPTGPASGMWVVDLDLDPVKKIDGIATLAQLIAQHGEIPKTLMTITPRGGRHLISAADNKAKIRNSAGKIGPGIDVRGEGGYVCLPPSRNANSACYRWDPDGADEAVAAPDWLVELATKSKTRDKAWARAALDHECKAVAAAQPGTRNDALNTATFNLFQIVAGGGLDEQRSATGCSRLPRSAASSPTMARHPYGLPSTAPRKRLVHNRAPDRSHGREPVLAPSFKS